MLSSSDFVHKEMADAVQSASAALRFENVYGAKAFTISTPIEGNLVESHMSEGVQTDGQETPILNAARHVMFLVTAVDKATVLKEVLEGPKETERLPAQGIDPRAGLLVWLVDDDAASQLKDE